MWLRDSQGNEKASAPMEIHAFGPYSELPESSASAAVSPRLTPAPLPKHSRVGTGAGGAAPLMMTTQA
eukprot:8580970-Alexandrium_andersonii.AAC.1